MKKRRAPRTPWRSRWCAPRGWTLGRGGGGQSRVQGTYPPPARERETETTARRKVSSTTRGARDGRQERTRHEGRDGRDRDEESEDEVLEEHGVWSMC